MAYLCGVLLYGLRQQACGTSLMSYYPTFVKFDNITNRVIRI